jgi:hypothetical protein
MFFLPNLNQTECSLVSDEEVILRPLPEFLLRVVNMISSPQQPAGSLNIIARRSQAHLEKELSGRQNHVDVLLTTESQRSQRFKMQQDSLLPKKRHRLKQTWTAPSGKNELVHFFHTGLSICPNVPSLGLTLRGSFKPCRVSPSVCSVSLW